MCTLKIHLGGGTVLQVIKKLNSLEELEILWVKKLSDISVISALKSLVRLKIEDEQHITALPDLSRLKHLKNIRLQNVGGQTDISAVASSHIKEFILTGLIRDADMLIPFATHKGIERVYTCLKNKSSQKKAEALLGAKFTKQMIFDMDNRASLHYFDLKEMKEINT